MAGAALRDQKDRQVEVNREKLVAILRDNKQKHIKEYDEAVLGYREMALEKLQSEYEKAKVSIERNLEKSKVLIQEFDPSASKKHSDWLTLVEAVNVQLPVPRNFSKEYDAAIDMASWDVRETLELTHAEFQCFVRDVWDWSNDFFEVSKRYTEKMA